MITAMVQTRTRDAVDHEVFRLQTKYGQLDIPSGASPEVHEQHRQIQADACDASVQRGDLTWRDLLLEQVFTVLVETDPERRARRLVELSALCEEHVASDVRRSGRMLL